jgi:hypothetical protein
MRPVDVSCVSTVIFSPERMVATGGIEASNA